MKTEDHPDVLKGILAGVAAGLFASFVMEQFQALWSKTAAALSDSGGSSSDEEKSGMKSEPTTVKVADAAWRRITGSPLPDDRKNVAGEAVHYALGGTSGAIYGALAEVTPLVRIGNGVGFGAAVWATADEIMLPMSGFAPPPKKTPFSIHIYALASHWAYGWVTEVVRDASRPTS